MKMDTRVGYATTSILEQITKDYITAHTIKGRYHGRLDYLLKYEELRKYNTKR